MNARHPAAFARSFLFVPGHRSELFHKALTSGSDIVVVDLEDAVPQGDKPLARAAAGEWIAQAPRPDAVAVRLNSLAVDTSREDTAWLASLARQPATLIVPKAECARPAQVGAVAPGAGLMPLVENAGGHAALDEMASASGVLRLAFGHLDFMVDTGIAAGEDEQELAHMRFAIAIATACAASPAIDGVTTDLDNEERLARDVKRAVAFGFGGKLCIHPRPVGGVHAALSLHTCRSGSLLPRLIRRPLAPESARGQPLLYGAE